MRRMNLRQRVIAVIGLAAALVVVGDWATTRWTATGWVGCAPLSGGCSTLPTALHPWVRMLIWLGLVVVWAVASMVLLRSRTGP